MKKSFFILLSFPLIFSNCQQNNPPPPSACGTLNAIVAGTTLSYNPDLTVGSTTTLPACATTNQFISSSASEQIILNFYSVCTSHGGPDFNITLSFTLLNSGSVVINQPYNYNISPTTGASSIVSIMYEAKNCATAAPLFNNMANQSGIFTFTQIDTANKLISGNCTSVTLESSGGSPLSFSCTFSDIPYN